METVKIVFDVDSKDIKTTTDELKALNKVTNEEVAAMDKLSNAATDAGDGFVSLRTRVKEAKEEAIKAAEKYGEFSQQALDAKKKAGQLADQMGDLNRQVNLLNPEAKAKAFANLAQGVVGAFSIATGALQAFGVKNKEVEALAMKLQAALNITQGIASLKGLKESLDDVKVVLGFTKAAQEGVTAAKEKDVIVNERLAASEIKAAGAGEALNATFLTNPIFLTVAAIGALAGAMIMMSDDTEEATTNINLMTESQKSLRSVTNDLSAATNRLGKAMGTLNDFDTQRIQANQQLTNSLQDVDDKINDTVNKYEIAAKKSAELAAEYQKRGGFFGPSKEEVAAAGAEATKLNEDLQNYYKEKETLRAANLVTIQAIDKEESNYNDQKAKDDLKALKEENKRKQEERDRAAEEQWQKEFALIKLRQQNEIDSAKTDEEKIALQQKYAVQNYQYELRHLEVTGATVTELQTLWEKYASIRIALSAKQDKAVQDSCDKQLKAEKDFIDKMNAISSKEKSPVEKIQEENDAIDKAYADQYAAAVANGEDTTAITEAYLKAVEAQQKKLTGVIIAEDEKRKKSADETAMARYNSEKEAMDRTIQATNELMNTLRSIQSAQYNQEQIDAQKQKEQGLLSEEEYQKKLKEIKHRQDVADKNAAIFKATLDFASAMINALKAPPLAVPAQLAFTAAIAGLNLAKIIATPLPKYQKGTLSVPGMDMGKDSVHAMLQPGEAVIPVSTNRAYHPTIKAIYEKKISPSEINNFVMSRTKAGGSSSVTANVDTYALGRVLSKNKGVQIENANLVGKAIAKEIGSRFNARNII